MSSQSIFGGSYLATYSIKVSDPVSYVEALDDLMETNWGRSFPAVVSLHQYVFNGYDDATHVVVLNYESTSNLGKGTDSFTNPVFQSFFAKTASIAEPVEQSLNLKLISGGNEDPENNQVYTIYRMEVSDPGGYAKEYSKLIKAQEDDGNIIGSYGLRQQVGGSLNYYTHYAYTSAGSVAQAMESAEVLYSSDSFAKFSKRMNDKRRIKNISILTSVTSYNGN
tara:strand:+ start:171 stop:839 length:669 start_codon:yes stop_codon:yes gene_type:complete